MKPRPLVPPAKGLSARGSGLRRVIDYHYAADAPASIVERVSEWGGRHGGEIAFAVLVVGGIVFLSWVLGGWVWVGR